MTLNDAIRLWPTPSATNPNEAEALDRWEARRDRLKAMGINGNGMGPPLGVAVGLWPTARAEDAESAGNHPGQQDSLTGATRLWPTPVRSDGDRASKTYANRQGNPTLPGLARLWPTPTARDDKGIDQPGRQGGHSLVNASRMWPTPRANKWGPADSHGSTPSLPTLTTSKPGHECSPECRRLNPRFVEWLQGLPIGWTDCERSATESYRSWQRTHGARFETAWTGGDA